MTSRSSTGASGAIRRFAGWVARGSVGHPLLDDIDYWPELRETPSAMETCFAIFANVLELDEDGEPVNEKFAEHRAAVWLYRYCTAEQSIRGYTHSAALRPLRAATGKSAPMFSAPELACALLVPAH